jgi:hypothetical protein
MHRMCWDSLAKIEIFWGWPTSNQLTYYIDFSKLTRMVHLKMIAPSGFYRTQLIPRLWDTKWALWLVVNSGQSCPALAVWSVYRAGTWQETICVPSRVHELFQADPGACVHLKPLIYTPVELVRRMYVFFVSTIGWDHCESCAVSWYFLFSPFAERPRVFRGMYVYYQASCSTF